MNMRHASLFSGIGGPEVAAAMLGWENVFHCEINGFGRKVLEYWFPQSDSYEDITRTDFSKYRGTIDVLTGGFPCQPFSYAGKRGGQSDERYLWPEMLRVINEVRPTWVIGENVDGIGTMVEQCRITDLGSEVTLFEKGNGVHLYSAEFTFTIERICSDLESKGYSVQPMLIPACAVGAPHRRDRIFFIAHYTDSCNDLRESGQHESESGKERLSERNEVRKPGESSDVKTELQVLVAQQILLYNSKPNNILTGSLVAEGEIMRFPVLWRYGNRNHILVSGTMDLLTGYLEDVKLMEYKEWNDLYPDDYYFVTEFNEQVMTEDNNNVIIGD